MENNNGSGDANDAVVRMEEGATPDPDVEQTADQQRLHAYLVHHGDAQSKLDSAHKKVAQAEADLEGAKASVKEAEAELAALEGRE